MVAAEECADCDARCDHQEDRTGWRHESRQYERYGRCGSHVRARKRDGLNAAAIQDF